MKLYKNLLLAFTICLGTSSCLDLDSQDQLADGNMWKTADDFKYFANNFYGWTRDFSTIISDGPHSDWRSDLMTSSSINQFSHGNNSIPTSDGNYTGAYSNIRRCNILLQKAQEYSGSQSIAQYISEAKFFRAYNYFELLQLYGDAIITDKPLDIDSPEMKAKRDDRSKVADFIIKDLEEAVDNLPETVGSEDDGRLTKWAGYAFLSRVALYEGTWQKFRGNTERGVTLLDKAATAAKKVIDSKKYELFKPAALGEFAYKYLFTLENVQSNPANLTKADNKEYIFYRRHDETLSPIGINVTHGCLKNVHYINRKIVNMYLTQNGLPIEKDPYQLIANEKGFKGYSGLTTEFENRDNRMNNTLIQHEQLYWNNDGTWRTTWTDEDEKNALKMNVRSNSGYQNYKWCVERQVPDWYESIDYPVIRYAEVLLNYTEAIYELSGNIANDELVYLNKVRKRINPTMPDLTNEFVAKNGLSMREEIRRERTVELFLEGFRIDDLKRWATAPAEMVQPQLGIQFTGTWFESNWNNQSRKLNEDGCIILYDDRVWDNKLYLYPLPSDQLQLNPQLKQNPGWGNN